MKYFLNGLTQVSVLVVGRVGGGVTKNEMNVRVQGWAQSNN